jgi:hypothetical protein
LFQINFYEASKAILKSGVGIGTPINEVLKQYEGQRTDTTTESGITCKPKGVGITCSKTNENKVSRFMIFMPSGKPPQSASAPATSTPPSNQVTGVTRTLAPTRPIPAAPLSARPKWASEPVIEGVGWGEAKLGMTEEELSKLLGSPDGKDKRYDTVSGVTKRPDGLVTHVYSPGSYKGYTYQTLPGVTFVIAPSRDLWRIDFQEESKAILQSGVRIGSPMDEVSQKYGHPSRTREVPYVGVLTDDDELAVSPTEYGIQRRTKGITFRFSKANENKLSGFFIHKSQPGTSRPTTAAAPVVAKPTLPTPITNIVSEAAGASGTTELFYDFSDPKQLEDFVVDDGQGRWEVKDGALVGVGRRVFGIRLRRRFEGAISVSWEQSLHRPAELGEPTDRDEVNGGLRLGELETDFMNCYQAKALFVRGTSVLGRQNERDHACELKAIYHIPPGRRFGIANIANPSTFVQGQPILLDQVQRFQIATEYRPSGTHVCFQGLGWRIENDKHSEIKPHFVKLSACDCMVKYRNLRVRFSKADAASLAAAATATPMPAPPSASATTAPPPAATTPPASVPSPVSATRLPMSGARTAAQLVNDYRNGLVFFEGKDGKGSGFITDYKGQKFLLSNAHVLAGIKGAIFKLLDRAPIKIGTGSVAVGHDIIALGVIAGGTAIPMIEAVDKEVLIGDPVVVLGNAEGAGVITPLEGRIIGIGPDRIEVDAPFVPGNSGSPIIHLPTGKVVGIATYMLVKKIGAREEKVRRFGWRLDSVAQWQTIDWNRFYTEADAMNGIERTTRDLINLLASLNACRNATRITLSGKAKLSDAKAFLIQMAFQEIKCETPAIQKALVVFKESSGGLQDIKDLQTTLNKVSVNELRSAETQITYDYFKQQLANEKRDHDEITNLLRKELEVY